MTVRPHGFPPTGGDGRTLVDRHAYGPTGARKAAGVRAPGMSARGLLDRTATPVAGGQTPLLVSGGR
ncbi:hypothetical protein FB563_5991 [Streptomyces puniciscabiei]|uniref:Uncharacterized protein n=1 Tax=Streptomyces puniciscabiei TaxID=164348 RepID=A0A542UP44_9ACTN|nr:hypothetical protein [Streptomyces puniciscabiei]TQL00859.1 hypothetical protein FB563_5991 [Streptomyces puniciscabiei]